MKAFYTNYGEYVYVVQWSLFDRVIVYYDMDNNKYFRVTFTYEEENGPVIFGVKEIVKPRFLTDAEIDILFPKNNEQTEFNKTTTTEEIVTEQESTEFSSGNQGDGGVDEEGSQNNTNQQETTIENNSESTKGNGGTSFTDSEREELNAFRREKKCGLIESFNEDLSKNFLEQLIKDVDKYSIDELEVVLSKEFTRVQKESKSRTQKFSPLNYTATKTNTEQSSLISIVEVYKDKK